MINYNDDLTIWNNAGDFQAMKTKPGKDKRLTNQADRKAAQAFRKARKNRHK